MKKALSCLLLSARKSRAGRPFHIHRPRPRLHIGCRQQYELDRSQIPFFIPSVSCFTNTSASSNHADTINLPVTTATYPPHSPFLFHSTTGNVATTEAASNQAFCVAHDELYTEKISVRDFSFGVEHCDLSTQEDAKEELSNKEARKLLKLVQLENFKKYMDGTGKNCLSIEEAVNLCKYTGIAINDTEAEDVLKILDEAGAILIFRRKVFLEPEKVAELLSRVMPLPLVQENDPRNQEFLSLQKEKEQIDLIAYKQVRHMLWGALGALSAQSAIFFRLTFWDLSWDVMEPITFFVTSSSLLAGFLFFVITKRDPSYHDFMDTLFSSKQQKLMKKRKFNAERFQELQAMYCLSTGGHMSHMQAQAKHPS